MPMGGACVLQSMMLRKRQQVGVRYLPGRPHTAEMDSILSTVYTIGIY